MSARSYIITACFLGLLNAPIQSMLNQDIWETHNVDKTYTYKPQPYKFTEPEKKVLNVLEKLIFILPVQYDPNTPENELNSTQLWINLLLKEEFEESDTRLNAQQTALDEQNKPELNKTLSDELMLRRYAFQKRKFLGLLTPGELEDPLAVSGPSIFFETQKKLNEQIELGAQTLKKRSLEELTRALIENSKKQAASIAIAKSVEIELINRCKNLLQYGQDAKIKKILKEIDNGFQYRLSSNFRIGTPEYSQNPYQSDTWPLKLLTRNTKIHQLEKILLENGLPIPIGATTFSFNSTKQSVAVGTQSGELFFINLITGDIVECRDQALYTPIKTTFFDASGKIIFAFQENGVLEAWDLVHQKKIFHAIMSPDGFVAIPNQNRSKLLFIKETEDSSDKPMTFVAPIVQLSPAEALLRKIYADEQPPAPNSPLFEYYKNCRDGSWLPK